MSTFNIELPDTVFASFHKTPGEFIKEMKIAAAVKWYELGEISQNRAAEIAQLSRTEFIETLTRYKVSILQYDEQILNYEMKNEQ